MTFLFYISALVAVVATGLAITRLNPVHALLHLVVSLLAVGVVFFSLGAHFAAALEVIVYAGAILVLFVFVIMVLGAASRAAIEERGWLTPGIWLGPLGLACVVLGELVWLVFAGGPAGGAVTEVAPADVGRLLFGPYVLGVEVASFLLLAGLIGAYHLAHHVAHAGRKGKTEEKVEGV